MSVSTSTDPVQTLIDILDATTAPGDWPNAGTKPTYIERQNVTEQSVKGRRTEDAVYVYGVDGDLSQFAADDAEYTDDQTATVDVWTPESSTKAEQLYQDVVRNVRAYVNDNGSQTEWQRIRPGTPSDLRPETHDRSGGHYRKTVDVDLHALR